MRSTGARPAAGDGRSINRDEVQHRARGVGAGGKVIVLLIVNISEDGLMARCEAPLDAGDLLGVQLPVVGGVEAQVRWALGGRIGCQFAPRIPPQSYAAVLAAMRTSGTPRA